MMDFTMFMQWAFLGIISGGVVAMFQLKNSVQQLNDRVLILVEKTIWHEKELEKHEMRISKLEVT